MFCPKCESTFEDELNFCQTCGSALKTMQESAAGSGSDGVVKGSRLKRFVGSPLRLASVVGGLVFLTALGSLAAYFNDGPASTVGAFVEAYKAKDASGLANEDFFPNPNGLQIAPQEILDSLETNDSAFLVSIDWEPGFGIATASVSFENGDALELKLDSRFGWWGVFPGRTWFISNEATSLTISKSPALPGSTILGLGETEIDFSSLEGLVGNEVSYLVFPGELRVRVNAAGLFDAKTLESPIPHGMETTLLLSEETLPVSKKANLVALAKAKSFAKSCADSECSSLPYISIDWSPYSPDSRYDYRTRSDSYSLDECVFGDWRPQSDLSAKFTFRCGISLFAMETQVTYYRYISDDWDFYYGTGNGEMEVSVSVEYIDGKFIAKTAEVGR